MLHFSLPLQDVIVEEDDNPQCRHAWRSVKKTRPRRQTPQKLSFVTQYNSGSHVCKSPMSQDFSLTRWFNRLLADPPIKAQADAVIFVALKKLLSVVFLLYFCIDERNQSWLISRISNSSGLNVHLKFACWCCCCFFFPLLMIKNKCVTKFLILVLIFFSLSRKRHNNVLYFY